ncbi:hypothetical protein HYZ41_00190 [archaeon]|nr:hypothetical protein [archaeon]
MPIKNIVSDWNGTLIKYPTEGRLMGEIGSSILNSDPYFEHPVKSITNGVRLMKHMTHLIDMKKKYKAGKIEYDAIYDYFNENVLRGTPEQIIEKAVKKYAAKAAEELDTGLLKAIRDFYNEDKNTGILSTGYMNGIIKTLCTLGTIPFHTVAANDIEWKNGEAVKFDLNIYKNKEKFLDDVFFKEHKYRPDETTYIGDTEEDEKCFEMVKYPIASFFATDDFKQHAAEKYNAFVAEEPEEYGRIIKYSS